MSTEELELLRENNALLKEIVSYIRQINDPKTMNEKAMKSLTINLLANLLLLNNR
jgi:hypothetical protein